MEVGGVDLGSLASTDRNLPNYVSEWHGERWFKLNYDSGAAVTALPVEMAEGLALEQRGEFRVASGAAIPNLGRVNIPTLDEHGVRRNMKGSITEVRKPLLSAAEASKGYDSYIFHDGGVLVLRFPRSS